MALRRNRTNRRRKPAGFARHYQHFAGQRVNLVNLRREYFCATPCAVKDALVEHHVELVEYQKSAPADEFTAFKDLRETAQLVGAR